MIPIAFLGFGVFTLLVHQVVALAGIHRINQCTTSTSFIPVFEDTSALAIDLQPVCNGALKEDDKGPFTLLPNSSIFTPYHATMSGGVSEKYIEGSILDDDLSWENGVGVLQFEYTLARKGPQTDRIFFDLSFINCGPTSTTSKEHCVFREGGYLIQFPEKTSEECPHVYCPHENQDERLCRSAYNFYNDIDTFACVDDQEHFWEHVNTTITFCPMMEQLERFNDTLNVGTPLELSS